MKSVEFPEQTIAIAKDQKEYNPLPAHVEGGVVTSCWEPDAEDIRNLAAYLSSLPGPLGNEKR
jgi:hypothetical protein